MRIFTKFHDYYDTAIGYGIDPAITYERKPEEHPTDSDVGKAVIEHIPDIKDRVRGLHTNWGWHKDDFGLSNIFAVIFCGEIIMGLEFTKEFKTERPDAVHYCYDFKSVQKIFKKYKRKLTSKKDYNSYYHRNTFMCKENVIRLFKEYNQKRKDNVVDLHFKIDSPIIVIKQIKNEHVGRYGRTSGGIYVNPCLKDIKFYKVYDAFTTFQELSMFIGGVMGGKVPKMVEISDSDRIAMHGYDKWSFRKMGKNSK